MVLGAQDKELRKCQRHILETYIIDNIYVNGTHIYINRGWHDVCLLS